MFLGIMLFTGITGAGAANVAPEDISASISLKVPGNDAKRYPLALQKMQNGVYSCRASEKLPLNIIRQVVGKAALIQSVGSAELLQEIEKAAGRLDICQDILLEVNIGGEAAKSGFSPEDIHAAAEMARALPHVQVRGLMTIPPVAAEPHGNLAYFEKMRWLYVDINAKIYDNKMEYLSMGMSGDFADAIRCGSNMIRVGTAIFGARDYTK